MFCFEESVNIIFRYNISQNDGTAQTAVLIPSGNPSAKVYNNTFYVAENVPFIKTNGSTVGQMELTNNIIYYSGTQQRQENWYTDTTQYSNNIFYNYTQLPQNGTENQPTDPLMKNPGKGGTATPTNIALDTLDGYVLQENSPAIGAGKPISNNGKKDFFGNIVVGVPSIGAHHIEMEDSNLEFGSTVYTINHDTKTIEGINWNSASEVRNLC